MLMIYDWARNQAKINPGKLAITLDDEQLTYGELEKESNQLAGKLLHNGVKPGVKVGLLLKKTPKAIIAMLAVSKAGGVYVPLDINSSVSRVSKILTSSDVRMLLVDHHSKKLFTQLKEENSDFADLPWAWCSKELNTLEESNAILFEHNEVSTQPDFPYAEVRDENTTAQIFFTSDSTGDPKGVEITHKKILPLLLNGRWAILA